MKMKKTLIAAAVASVCAAPIAAQAADVSGEFIAGIENRNDDANGTFVNDNGTPNNPNDDFIVDREGDTSIVLDTAALGIEGGEDLGNGLRIDAGVAFEGVTPTGSAAQWDSGYGTLSGDFGSLTLGFGVDSVYYMHANAPTDVGIIYDTYTVLGNTGDEAEPAIQYGYDAGAVSFGVEAVMDSSSSGGGETETLDRLGIGATFDAGIVSVGVAHQSESNPGNNVAEPSTTGVSVSGSFGGANLAAAYQMYDSDTSGAAEPSSIDLVGTMDFGGGLSGGLSFSMLDADTNDGSGDTDTITAQISQSLSSRTYVFGNVMSQSVDGGSGADTDPRALFVGVGHAF